jgi:hypothetical protein
MFGTSFLDQALQQLVSINTKPGAQLSPCRTEDKGRLHQRFAYLALLFSTGKGAKLSWYNNTDECQWAGIRCHNKRFYYVELFGRDLQGTIPDDVGLWNNLFVFNMFDNRLSGKLPTSIGKWTNMNYFVVANNTLTGLIPEEVANWGIIATAAFQGNMFRGTMPPIGIAKKFCPRGSTATGVMYADCQPPSAEIVCSCCTYCCDATGTTYTLQT